MRKIGLAMTVVLSLVASSPALAALKVDVMNCMAFLPVAGSEFEAISPPVFPSPLSERLLGQWSYLGDELERLLSVRLGPQRARQLRYSPKAASWMQRSTMGGCPAP